MVTKNTIYRKPYTHNKKLCCPVADRPHDALCLGLLVVSFNQYIQLYSPFGRTKIKYKNSQTGHIIKNTQNIDMHAH